MFKKYHCKSILLISILVVLFCFTSANAFMKGQNKYHELTETDCFRVPKIHKIFKQVLAAADTSSNRVPKLILTKDEVDPWVFCLKNGEVIISRKAIDACYQEVDQSVGDARISLLIGHELSHLAKDDFWEQSAFAFSSQETSGAMSDLFEDVMKNKELKADEYGFFYSSIAGFDVQLVLDYQGESFFQHWERYMMQDMSVPSKGDHPSADERTQRLDQKLIEFQEDLNLFYNGISLYQVGKFSSARTFLSAFKEEYPGRAVFNALGLIEYELAMEHLRKFNPQKADQFMLSTIVDTRTRAENLRKTFATRTKQSDDQAFKEHIEHAIDHFKMAKKKDPFYVPARINLSSALILADYNNEAITVLKEALSITQKTNNSQPLLTAQIYNNLAIARYKDGMQIDVDLSKKAMGYLSQSIESYQKLPASYYNLAVLSEINHLDAHGFFQTFLQFESTGNYAQIAENTLGISHTAQQRCPLDVIGESPIPLKPFMDAETDNLITKLGLSHKPNKIDGHVIDTYTNDKMKILCINRIVQLVDCVFEFSNHFSEIKMQLPRPCRVLETLADIKVFVYEGFALKVHDNHVLRVIYFTL
jgi:tetratricopeptide (TPR) repeat protein